MHKIIFIVGPTGVGKTELSLQLATALNTEIISTDSMQIYKGMDIGTAKASKAERQLVPHHCIDMVRPDELFTVDDFQNKSTRIIEDLTKQGKIPLFVGGTGLYANSILYDLQFLGKPNQEIRQKYENILKKQGKEALYEMLLRVDSDAAKKIHPNNTKRVIRALEIFDTTGKPMSQQNKGFRKKNTKYDFYIIGLTAPRNLLYERINKRVIKMMESGLVEEVRSLLLAYPNFESFIAAKGIGYKELIPYIKNEYDLSTAISKIQRNSRNYAKRQITWFKPDDRVQWFDISSQDLSSIASQCLHTINHWSK